MYSSRFVRTRIRPAAVAWSLAAIAVSPAMASAAVTQLNQGTGISLSPNPITGTGTVSLALPLNIAQPLPGPLVSITNTTGDALDAVGPVGVRAKVNGSGQYAVIATGGNGGGGVLASGGSTSGFGVKGTGSGDTPGVLGYGGAGGGTGVKGTGGGKSAVGVEGDGAGGRAGVYGLGGPSGPGIRGVGHGAGAGLVGVAGSAGDGVDGTTPGSGTFGISGVSTCSTCSNGIPLSSNTAGGHFTANTGYGVFGYSTADNGGVFENNSDSWFALYSQADSAMGFPFEAENSQTGGYMYLDPQGNLFVSGTVTANGTVLSAPAAGAVPRGHVPGRAAGDAGGQVSGSTFDGNVTTNARGFATVRLPANFDARNQDPRYQLTAIGPRGWNAKIGIWRPERHNRFVIRTDQSRVKVSWHVTAIPRG